MILERHAALWELGALFRSYYTSVQGRCPPGTVAAPPEAVAGLGAGHMIIQRPGHKQTPTGLVTWSRRGSEAEVDFIYAAEPEADDVLPRGAALLLSCWGELVSRPDVSAIRTSFGRFLAAAGEDFLSPLAQRLGMMRSDDVLLVKEPRQKGEAHFPAGFKLTEWSDYRLDLAIKVMLASPDPGRLGDWNEQLCRDELLWAASGDPPGFRDGRALLVWKGNTLAGLAVAAADGHVSQVHVKPEYQNKGVGTALLRELLNRLHRNGVREATAMIGEINGEALRLFERAGFQEDIRYPTWVWRREPLNLDGVDMRWDERLIRREVCDLMLRTPALTGFSPGPLMRGLKQSHSVLEARQRGELLGMARIVGDGATIACVSELVVDPAVRFQGLGRAMVSEIKRRFAEMPRLVFLPSRGKSTFLERSGLRDVQGHYVAPPASD